jgi:light-regulated signal transduction histidine kinase (bacteriophytochrome)
MDSGGNRTLKAAGRRLRAAPGLDPGQSHLEGLVAELVRENAELRQRGAEWDQSQSELRAAHEQIAHDLQVWEKAEVRLRSKQKLYFALSQANLAIFRIQDDQALFQKICDITSEFGEFVLAWIALEDPARRCLRVAARSGSPLPYLDGIQISLDPESPFGQGPTGTAVRLGRPAVSNDLRLDPVMAPWRERAGRYGIEAVAAFPVRRSGRVIGALSVHADRPGFFDPETVTLLAEIADCLSFALDAIDRQRDLLESEARYRELNGELEERIRNRTALLEAANAELDAFSYSVSHDLRAPLRAIDGFSLAVLEDCGDQLNPEGKGYLQRVRAGTARMGRLIDDLLALSRAGRARLDLQTLDLTAMALAVLEDLAQAGPARTVELRVEAGLTAGGDPGLVHSVLANLLGNAWKYSAKVPAARIELFAAPLPDGSRGFCVRDNGAGFDTAHAGQLFQPFQRLHASDDFAGSGIGLAIVKRIVHRHGGEVWAQGAAGAGASFFFSLPGLP